ncbi:hypothetical protein CCP2SC5_1730002 [Azospirillaceae bacterium]
MSSYIAPNRTFPDARSEPPPPPWTVPLEQVRAGFSKLWQRLGAPPRPMHEEREIIIPGPRGPIRCRLYVPRLSTEPLPILIFYHGGGCILMSPEDYASTNSALAADADCLVLAPDYRLAPENPFPAPLEDAYAALAWTQENAAAINGDSRRIAVAGDSGGGYLTAAVALEAKRLGTPQPCCQVLIYPMIDAAAKTPSRITESLFLSDPVIEWTNRLHFGDHVLDPRASPIRASDHSGLAPP